MGTSGSYGGSSKKVWEDARQQVLDVLAGVGGPGNGDPEPPSDEALDDFWEQVADALDSDDSSLHQPADQGPDVSLPSLLPWLSSSTSGAGAGAGSGGGGPRTGSGRQGTGSRRQVTRSAARGGAALGAAFAVRTGDSDYLGEMGLDLTQLQELSPVRQCARILDAVLGEGAHPDELALRKASLEALKAVLGADQMPDEASALRLFVSSYVFELSLVELQRQVNEGALAPEHVAKRERVIKRYLEKRVQNIEIPGGNVIRPRDIRERATQLTKEVIRVLRAGAGEST